MPLAYFRDEMFLRHSACYMLSSSSLSGGDSASIQEPWNLGKRLVNPNKRLKKPYSRDSLIEFNFTPVDKPLEWEVKGVTYILKT